jgi:hypothetical protein
MKDSWRINPGGVEKAITEAEEQQQTLTGLAEQVRSRPAGATIAGGPDIAEFLQSRVRPLEWMTTRITDVVHGTEQAVSAYEDGDLAMAAEQQRFASTIGAPQPFREARQGPLGPRKPL